MVAKQRDDENESGTTRTTLTLGNDALRLLRREAEVSGHTEGEIVTDLIRERALAARDEGEPPSLVNDEGEPEVPVPGEYYKGILLVPKRGDRRPVTSEFVRELLDEFP